jgi:hypothetical protein
VKSVRSFVPVLQATSDSVSEVEEICDSLFNAKQMFLKQLAKFLAALGIVAVLFMGYGYAHMRAMRRACIGASAQN